MKEKNCKNLSELIDQLKTVFADDHVNVEEVTDLLESYKSDRSDWAKFAKFDPHKYTRNLVDEGNGKYNLMVLCWGEGMGSSVHDHSNSHCFVKILDGKLRETLYDWPKEEGDQLHVKSIKTYGENGVTYMSDELGLHRMENPSHTDPTVTLHLYIPAFDSCYMFDERTGHKSKCKVTFWSKYGQKIDYMNNSNGLAGPKINPPPTSEKNLVVSH